MNIGITTVLVMKEKSSRNDFFNFVQNIYIKVNNSVFFIKILWLYMKKNIQCLIVCFLLMASSTVVVGDVPKEKYSVNTVDDLDDFIIEKRVWFIIPNWEKHRN